MKVDMVVIRHPSPGASVFLSKNIDSCIINAGDGTHEHPTQALLDAYSLIEKIDNLKNKNILIVGDIMHSRVALSNIYAYQKLGANVTVCGPKSLIPNDIESLNVTVDTDFINALKHCDAVNMLRIQNERMSESYFPSVREYVQQYGLNKSILDSLDKKIIVMHPGPINRGVEITSEVADSDQAIILDQVENGVAIRMAVMYLLAAKLK
jgi:aspartate carbamoyltransferase catalytic subunit